MSLSVVRYGFAKINGKQIPYPSTDSGLQNTATFVDSARNANGVVIGEVIGRNVGKVEMTWNILTCEEWSTILKEVRDHFYFTFEYWDMTENKMISRKFYCGDRSAKPMKINPTTNKPEYWVNCKMNVIDVGE